MKIDPKTILGIALLGGIGFVAWKFYKGDWKLPSLGSILPSITDIPGVPADIKVTLAESGVPGAAGDIIYNLFSPDNLREQTTVPTGKFYQESEQEIKTILPPGTTPTPEQIVPRAVAMKVSTDIVKERGFIPSMLLAPVTIGAGLGAITQQERYYKSLPDETTKREAIRKTVVQRQTWKKEHPVEYVAATALSSMFLPALIIGKAAEVRDVIRSRPLPVKTATVAAAPRPVPTTAVPSSELTRLRSTLSNVGLSPSTRTAIQRRIAVLT